MRTPHDIDFILIVFFFLVVVPISSQVRPTQVTPGQVLPCLSIRIRRRRSPTAQQTTPVPDSVTVQYSAANRPSLFPAFRTPSHITGDSTPQGPLADRSIRYRVLLSLCLVPSGLFPLQAALFERRCLAIRPASPPRSPVPQELLALILFRLRLS